VTAHAQCSVTTGQRVLRPSGLDQQRYVVRLFVVEWRIYQRAASMEQATNGGQFIDFFK